MRSVDRGNSQRSGETRSRVVIVGSGFGGYYAARELRGADLDVTLISATDGMLYAPLLPDVAVGAVDPRSAVVPLAGTLGGTTVVRGTVDKVDFERRAVRYVGVDEQTREVPYDRLLLAPGGVTKLLDIPGLADHAIGLKTVTEALFLRDHVLGRVELAATLADPRARRAALRFVVVGAGYAGVELTAQMARLTTRLLPTHPTLSIGDIHWLLVDVAEAVMPELGDSLGRDALALLRRRGVDVRLGVSLEEVTDDRVRLTDGTTLECSTVIWCAGVTANPLIGRLGLSVVKGRLAVNDHLAVAGQPAVYAIGDAAAVPDLTKPVGDDGERPLCPPTTPCGRPGRRPETWPLISGSDPRSRIGTTTSDSSSISVGPTPPPLRSDYACAAGWPNWSPEVITSTPCRRCAAGPASPPTGRWPDRAQTT